MTSTYATKRRSCRRQTMIPVALLMTPLCGCVAGSSASITQAPLLFAEQAAPPIAPASTSPAVNTATASLISVALQTEDSGYLAIGGNALLPLTTLASIDAPIGGMGTKLMPLAAATQALTAPIATVSQTVASPVAAIMQAAAAPLTTVAQTVAVPLTAVAQTVAAPLATVSQASTPALAVVSQAAATAGATVNAVAAVLGGLANGLSPAAPPVRQSPNAVPAIVTPVTGAVSAVLVTTQPILTGATAPPPTAPGSNLLSMSASNLVRICLLKGCR